MTPTIVLEIPDESFGIIEEFASHEGSNPAAALTSAIKFHAEWIIFGKSFDRIAVSKR